MRILIVEDDRRLCELLSIQLKNAGYETDCCYDGEDAMFYIMEQAHDMILLDRMLPVVDGLTVLKRMREKNIMTPVIFLTALGQLQDKINGLDAGADDYLVKPFEFEELLARIRTAIRHTRTVAATPGLGQSGTFVSGSFVIDYDKHRVFVEGKDANLTQNEFKIVALLGKYAGRVMTYDYIMKEIWGPNMKNDNQILRVNMANIRRKIEKNPAQPKYIFTEAGVGYRMVEAD